MLPSDHEMWSCDLVRTRSIARGYYSSLTFRGTAVIALTSRCVDIIRYCITNIVPQTSGVSARNILCCRNCLTELNMSL